MNNKMKRNKGDHWSSFECVSLLLCVKITSRITRLTTFVEKYKSSWKIVYYYNKANKCIEKAHSLLFFSLFFNNVIITIRTLVILLSDCYVTIKYKKKKIGAK